MEVSGIFRSLPFHGTSWPPFPSVSEGGGHDGLPSACFFFFSRLSFHLTIEKARVEEKGNESGDARNAAAERNPPPSLAVQLSQTRAKNIFFPFHHTGLHYRHDGCESSSKRATEKSPDDCTLRTPPSWLPRSTHPSPLPSLLSPACGILFLPVLGDLFVR